VLRCCVVEGRHTAFAIAAFLLQVARDFDLSTKVGIVRTDAASNCVAAGAVLGDVGGRDYWEAGHLEVADGLALGTETRADEGGASARHGGEIVSAEAGLRAAGGSSMGDGNASRGGVDGGAGADFDSDNDEGGDGADLPDVGSDSEDTAGGASDTRQSRDGPTGVENDDTTTADGRADAFCIEIPAALHAGALCVGMKFQKLSRERYSNINKEVSSELDGGLPSRKSRNKTGT